MPKPQDLTVKDTLVVNANVGTMNGVSGNDPVYGAAPPPWFAGTSSMDDYVTSHASIVAEDGVPMVFFDPVPQKIELAADVVVAIQKVAKADADPCNDGADYCKGVLADEKTINHCLTSATFAMKDLTLDPYLNYAVALSRVADAAELVLNRYYATLKAPPVKFAKLISHG